MNDELTSTTTTAVQINPADAADPVVDARFVYDPADPLAVTMLIESVSGPVAWTFARELILDGQFEPTGDGDVHVWPCLDREGAAVVVVELLSPEGAALLQFPSRAIRQFAADSLRAVPEGAECYDVEAWLEQLLPGGEGGPAA